MILTCSCLQQKRSFFTASYSSGETYRQFLEYLSVQILSNVTLLSEAVKIWYSFNLLKLLEPDVWKPHHLEYRRFDDYHMKNYNEKINNSTSCSFKTYTWQKTNVKAWWLQNRLKFQLWVTLSPHRQFIAYESHSVYPAHQVAHTRKLPKWSVNIKNRVKSSVRTELPPTSIFSSTRSLSVSFNIV